MACPHSSSPASTPESCSQCHMAKPKVITRDSTGRLLIDGKVPVDPNTGEEHVDGRAPAYGRTVPKKRKVTSKAVRQLRLVEPEPVDDLDD